MIFNIEIEQLENTFDIYKILINMLYKFTLIHKYQNVTKI